MISKERAEQLKKIVLKEHRAKIEEELVLEGMRAIAKEMAQYRVKNTYHGGVWYKTYMMPMSAEELRGKPLTNEYKDGRLTEKDKSRIGRTGALIKKLDERERISAENSKLHPSPWDDPTVDPFTEIELTKK